MEVRSAPNLLTLRGVKLADLNIIKPPPRIPAKQYTDIPKTFTSVATWPKKSNLKCWECGLVPDSYPKFIPMYPRKVDGADVCDAHGHFCEWACVARHIQTNNFPNKLELLEIVLIFEAKFSGNKKKMIVASPPKTLMQDYSGASGCTVEEYKRKLRMAV